MASSPFRFSFANSRPEERASEPAARTDGGSGSDTGSATEPDNGTSRDETRASDSQGRTFADAPIGPKRRGRQPYPRDAEGRIIRPDGTTGPKTYTRSKDRLGVDPNAFVPNDRDALRENYKGMHEALAQLLMQPMLDITDEQARLGADKTADLCDRLEWNITGNGKSGNIYILTFMWALTMYRIEAPKVAYMVASARARNVTPTAPASIAEARARGNGATGQMDFSADIEASVNQGTTNPPGQYQYN